MDQDTRRAVTIRRLSTGVYEATNPRGGTIVLGSDAGETFTPVEALLAAIAACSAVDVDVVTGRRAEPEAFDVDVEAHKVRDDSGSHLVDIAMTFRLRFPEGEAGEAARTVLPQAVRASHDRTCTVSRTVERGTPVTVTIAEDV